MKQRKCSLVACPWNAMPGDCYCTACAYWVRVVLADNRYRNETPPPPPYERVSNEA